MQSEDVSADLFQQALAGTDEELLAIIPRAAPDMVRAILKNPALAEHHVLTILKRRDLGEDNIRRICKLSLTESSHRLKVALAGHPDTPAPQLLALLPHLYLFELLSLCHLPGTTPDQKLAAERAIIRQLPTTPLGNKLTLARRATATLLEVLLKDGDTRLLEVCLANPRLREGTVFQFLRSAAATATTISMIARHHRWQNLPSLREAILTNPKTPLIWFTLWIPAMKRVDLVRLMGSGRLTPPQKEAVAARLQRTP